MVLAILRNKSSLLDSVPDSLLLGSVFVSSFIDPSPLGVEWWLFVETWGLVGVNLSFSREKTFILAGRDERSFRPFSGSTCDSPFIPSSMLGVGLGSVVLGSWAAPTVLNDFGFRRIPRFVGVSTGLSCALFRFLVLRAGGGPDEVSIPRLLREAGERFR